MAEIPKMSMEWDRSVTRNLCKTVFNLFSFLRDNTEKDDEEVFTKQNFYVQLAETMMHFRRKGDSSHAILWATMNSKRWADCFKRDKWVADYFYLHVNTNEITEVTTPEAATSAKEDEFLMTAVHPLPDFCSNYGILKVLPLKVMIVRFMILAKWKYAAKIPPENLNTAAKMQKKLDEMVSEEHEFDLNNFYFSNAKMKDFVKNCYNSTLNKNLDENPGKNDVMKQVFRNKDSWDLLTFNYDSLFDNSGESAMKKLIESNGALPTQVNELAYNLNYYGKYYMRFLRQHYRRLTDTMREDFREDRLTAIEKYGYNEQSKEKMKRKFCEISE